MTYGQYCRDEFLAVGDQKIYMNTCLVLGGYGVVAAWNIEHKLRIAENKRNKIINEHNTL